MDSDVKEKVLKVLQERKDKWNDSLCAAKEKVLPLQNWWMSDHAVPNTIFNICLEVFCTCPDKQHKQLKMTEKEQMSVNEDSSAIELCPLNNSYVAKKLIVETFLQTEHLRVIPFKIENEVVGQEIAEGGVNVKELTESPFTY